MSYCQYCRTLVPENIHRIHHDTKYGMAIKDDNELFGRLILEINQAGLSWDTILKREEAFRIAYSNFNIQKIAQYKEEDKQRLLSNATIIRNRLKIDAIIFNAQKIELIQAYFGSFFKWIQIQNCTELKDWVKVFKSEFKFVGGEIVNEFLMTIGRIGTSHLVDCPQYEEYIERRKIWELSK